MKVLHCLIATSIPIATICIGIMVDTLRDKNHPYWETNPGTIIEYDSLDQLPKHILDGFEPIDQFFKLMRYLNIGSVIGCIVGLILRHIYLAKFVKMITYT
jgi:hypothetical protein